MRADWNTLLANLPPLTEPVRFSLADRQAGLRALHRREFDALVIGGGFNGCAVAAELAWQGLRTAVVERDDFCSATSMASGIVLWGGIKYLASLDFALVRRSCIERNRFLRRAPHVVREREFFSPVYAGDPYGLWSRWIGAWLHFLLGGAWWGTREPRLHRGRTAALAKDPRLRPEGLRGGVSYWDTELETSDAHLGLALALAAAARGAAVVNRCELLGFLFDAERIAAAWCRDRQTGREFPVKARLYVNACGPWAEKVNGMAVWNDPPHRLVLRRGTFLITEPGLFDTGGDSLPPPPHALTIFAAADRRPMFFYPWGPRFLAGTTDVPMDMDAVNSIETSPEEFDYLRAEIPRRLRLRAPLSELTIIESRVGARPLAVRKDKARAPDDRDALSISRRHAVDVHFQRGLLTILGGKLTPARDLAAEVARTILHHWPDVFRGRPCGDSTEVPVYGAETVRALDALRRHARQHLGRAELDPDLVESLVAQWGEHSAEPLGLMQWYPDLRNRVYPDLPYTWADLVHNVRNRMVHSLDDLLRRRTNIAQWIPRGGLGKNGESRDAVDQIARLIRAAHPAAAPDPETMLAEYESLVDRRNRWLRPAPAETDRLPSPERIIAP